MIGDLMQILVKSEKRILAECEATIKQGLANFIEVGNALMRIREGKLYRQEYKTFEAYCLEKWGMSRMRASQLISAAGVMENVNHGLQKPTSERQARPLAGLEPEQQKEVWMSATEKAKEENRKVTARDVEMAKAEIVEEIDEEPEIETSSNSPVKKAKYIPPSNGMQFAKLAIMKLSEIKADDTERKQALTLVKEWIHENE